MKVSKVHKLDLSGIKPLSCKLQSHAVATHHRRAVYAAASTSASEALITLLDSDQAQNSTQALSAAVDKFIAESDTRNAAVDSLKQVGKWKVFYAPHIQKLSSLFGAKFEIEYTLLPSGTRTSPPIYSNVKFSHPVLGEGWLSASGCLKALDDTTSLELKFDTFWFDIGSENLRRYIYYSDTGTAADAVLSFIGRLFFIRQFAVFPVLALDGERGVSVFRFPPLKSNIAVRRVMSV